MSVFSFFTRTSDENYPYSYVKIDNVRHMRWALSHLKSSEEYSKVWQQFNKLDESVCQYNKAVGNILNELDKHFTALLSKSYPGLVINDSNTYEWMKKR